MTTKQAHGMLLFHQRAARAYRQILAEPKKRSAKERQRLKENAHSADMRAAECQAILQVARMSGE